MSHVPVCWSQLAGDKEVSMGNSSSSSLSGGRPHHDDSVDCGFLVPNGVYTGPRDWNHAVVSQFIVARRLAPFYPPLEDYDASWDDSQILAARKEFPPSTDTTDTMPPASSRRRSIVHRNQPRPEMAVYRGAVECPICFLVSRFLQLRFLAHCVTHTVLSPKYQLL